MTKHQVRPLPCLFAELADVAYNGESYQPEVFTATSTFLRDAYNPSCVASAVNFIAPYFNEDGTPSSALPDISSCLETAASNLTESFPGGTIQDERVHYLSMREMFAGMPIMAAMARPLDGDGGPQGITVEELASTVRWSASMQDEIMDHSKVRLPSSPSWQPAQLSTICCCMPLAYCSSTTGTESFSAGAQAIQCNIGLTGCHCDRVTLWKGWESSDATCIECTPVLQALLSNPSRLPALHSVISLRA